MGTLGSADESAKFCGNVMQSNALSQLEESIAKLEVMVENGRPAYKQYAADLGSIMEARERIAAYIHTTPVVTSSSLDDVAGCNLFFKCEFLQKGDHILRPKAHRIIGRLLTRKTSI